MTPTTAALVVAHQHRLVIIAATRRPAVGEMTVEHRLHHFALVGTRLPTAGVMIAEPHRHHVSLAEMTIDAMTNDAATIAEIVVSPRRAIVDAATRFRRVHLVLVGVMSVSTSVHRRHVERAVETGTGTALVLVIMTAKEMVRGKGTGIVDADTNAA